METVFKTHEVNIDYNSGDILNFIPFGDIHRDTPSCDVDRWRWFLDGCKQYPQDKTYYLGMGDFNDFASSKEQSIIQNSALHDQTKNKFDEIVIRDNRRLVNEMSFMKGHMIGLLDGNHNWRFPDGKTGTEDLAERLNAPYLGWLSHITVNLKMHTAEGNLRGSSIRMFIVACHGKAGGKLAGATINQVDDLKRVFPVADIYAMGHDHQRAAHPTAVLVPDQKGSGIKQKRQFLVRSGSFKKGYCDGVSGYEVGRLLRPSDLGAVVLQVSVHRDARETDRLILDVKAVI
jgi:hypothetical protein